MKIDLSASSPSHLGNRNQPKSPSSLSKVYKSNIPHQVGLSHAVSIPDTTATTTSDNSDEDNQDNQPLVEPTVDYSSNSISRSNSGSSKSSYSLSRSGSVSSSYSRSQTPTPTTTTEIEI